MGSGWRPALRQSEVASTLTSETIMQSIVPRPEKSAAIRTDFGAIFVSLELSRSTWLITSLSPGAGEKMRKYLVPGGDVAGLRRRFQRLPRESLAAEREDLPCHRHSGGWSRRVRSPQGIAGEQCRRCG